MKFIHFPDKKFVIGVFNKSRNQDIGYCKPPLEYFINILTVTHKLSIEDTVELFDDIQDINSKTSTQELFHYF